MPSGAAIIHIKWIFLTPRFLSRVLAAAAALLAAIIATFALHNYRLEKALMREVLEQRAATLVRVLYSSIRVAMRNELRQQGQLGSGWLAQLQQALERVKDDHEVSFLQARYLPTLTLKKKVVRLISPQRAVGATSAFSLPGKRAWDRS